MILPGQDEANRLGYHVASFSGDHKMARYVKGDLMLKVWISEQGDLQARLFGFYGLFSIESGNMSFPNKNFGIFELELIGILRALPPETP